MNNDFTVEVDKPDLAKALKIQDQSILIEFTGIGDFTMIVVSKYDKKIRASISLKVVKNNSEL